MANKLKESEVSKKRGDKISICQGKCKTISYAQFNSIHNHTITHFISWLHLEPMPESKGVCDHVHN